MALGYILISTLPAKENNIYNSLKQMNGIEEVHLTFGLYDLIAKVKAENMDAVGRFVKDNVRTIDGVLDTKTLAILPPPHLSE